MKILKRSGFLAVAVMAVAASGPALALPSHWREFEYYSDATYTEMVGYWGQTCAGTVYKDGVRTAYAVQVLNDPC